MIVEALGEIEGDDAVGVTDDHALARGEARQQIEAKTAVVHVPRHDRQAEITELQNQPSFGLLGLGELAERDGVVGIRSAPGEPAGEAASRWGALPDHPVAVPVPVRARVPGLPVDDRLPAAYAIELPIQQVVAEFCRAVRAAQRVQIDELPAVRAPGLGDHTVTVVPAHGMLPSGRRVRR